MLPRYRFSLIAMLLFSCIVPVFSFEPSGGVLLLDGEDDYAILPFAEHGYIFPAGTREFTVEVWFYTKVKPEQKDRDLILTQQVSIGVTTKDNCGTEKNEVCCYRQVYLQGEGVRVLVGSDATIEKNQWNYVAIIYKDSTLYFASTDQVSRGQKWDLANQVQTALRKPIRLDDFFVGGYGNNKRVFDDGEPLYQVSSFNGAIDAIRFSNIARYDLPDAPGIEPFDPPHRFFRDAHTLAFWDFNENIGATRFDDQSGNGYTLIGMNGAAMSGGVGLGVRPDNSLTTTWGQIKSK